MTKPYRSLSYNDERKWKTTHLLDDVLQVGKHKAIGYVASEKNSSFLENAIGYNLDELYTQLTKPGTLTVIRTNNERPGLTKLWVGDVKMMRRILNKNADIIIKNNWPLLPEKFFDRISVESIDHHNNPDMYHVVCDLFNSWCLWCEQPVWRKCPDGSTKPFSVNSYDPDEQ